jgi:chemotaxis protein histidine kinase CheA
MKFVAEQLDVASFLNRLYAKMHRFDSAYAYQGIMIALNDSVYSNEKVKAADSIKYDEALREEQAKQDKLRQQIKEANLQKQLQQVQTEKQSLLKNILLISIAIIIVFTVVVLRNIMLKRRNEKTESEKRQADLQHQKAEVEMQALRAQMNPHFIFNSLNSINRFILKKQGAEASEYLTKFSRLIRMILNSSANASVTLAEDLEALKLYLELERLRCDDKFSFKIECEPDMDIDYIQIPPMLLQPFVENAIWHGLMNKESEGHLWINIDQHKSTIICTITDDGIGRKKAAELKQTSVKHKSMGMKITESRIAMMQKMNVDGKSIEITDLVDADGNAAGTEVVIRMPVLEEI